MDSMKAIVCPRYGGAEVLEFRDVPDPQLGEEDVLVKAHASSVNALDWRVARAEPFLIRLFTGLRRPHKVKVAGADVAGTVEAVGAKVTRFRPGDEVFAEVGILGYGGFSELASVPEDKLAHKPKRVSFEEAAAAPVAGLAALQGMRDFAALTPGQRVLVTGAGGGVGTYAVQVAKAMGAEVTAVCGTDKVELAQSLGADHVVDYTKRDYADTDVRYDVVFDIAATRPIGHAKRILTPSGTYVFIGGASGPMWQAMLFGPLVYGRGNQRFVGKSAVSSGSDLKILADWMESGRVKSVIGRTYRLEDVPDAVAYVAEGHAKGKTVITI